MSPASRLRRAQLRELHSRSLAKRRVASGMPQPARVHLVAVGAPVTLATRYAAAFSKGVTPTTVGETMIKRSGGKRMVVPVKLYDVVTFAQRLSVYRPKKQADAVIFTRLAA